MWDWVLYGNPIPGMLIEDLNNDQQATLRRILDGMLRERSEGSGPAVLTNAVNIGRDEVRSELWRQSSACR
jgi:hypothetical protein